MKNRVKIAAKLAIVISIPIFFWITNVPTKLTDDDRSVLAYHLSIERPQRYSSFSAEIAQIREIQSKIIKLAPRGRPIPDYHEREPRDLFAHGEGSCFDRSRTIEKALAFAGFRVRHVFIIFKKSRLTDENSNALSVLMTRGTRSHALTEVKTSAGWMLVDSNSTWVSLSKKTGMPVSIESVISGQSDIETPPDWISPDQPVIFVRGLYSRRGQFYPPFLSIPEVNWHDIFDSLIEFRSAK